MECPKCKDVVMVRYNSSRDVELDLCPNCRGIWLDEGEMLHFIDDAEKQLAALNQGIGEGEETGLSCTSCHAGTLRKGKLAGFSDLELEFCSNCGGFFLDEGEMGRLEEK